MRNKYFKAKNFRLVKRLLLIFFLITIALSEFSMIVFSLKLNQISNSQSDSRLKKKLNYEDLPLNNSASFILDSKSYCNELQFNFTSLNETRNFIQNGDLNLSSSGWSASNNTDVNFQWKNEGPENTKCVGINITSFKSKSLIKPLDAYMGIINFTTINGWTFINNDSTHFKQGRDPYKGHPILSDSTGSLIHNLTNLIGIGLANSSYKFFFDSSFPLFLVNLSFWYYWRNPGYGFGNLIDIGIYLITPSQKCFVIDDWIKILDNDSALYFHNKCFSNISKYFTETGFYNLTFFSIHNNFWDFNSMVHFDDLELNIVYSYKKFNSNDSLIWNQKTYFNREVFTEGTFNFSYYLTEKFQHINNFNTFLSAWINNHQFNITSIKSATNNSWISTSISVDKTLIGSNDLNIKIGLFFNQTTYLFPNETFSIFFDNISFLIGANPNPVQLDLRVYVPKLNNSYAVQRDLSNHDFVQIYRENFIFGPNEIGLLNLTCNSSGVIVTFTLNYFIYEPSDGENDEEEEDQESEEKVNITIVLLVLILLISFATFIYTIRTQKRLFINPKYDYIKKMKIKRKLDLKSERSKTEGTKKKCNSCGKMINARAKFCEHCGSLQ